MDTSKIIAYVAEKCQRDFRANLTTEVIDKKGPDHSPVITVKVTFPEGEFFFGKGSNQKIAKAEACKQAMMEIWDEDPSDFD